MQLGLVALMLNVLENVRKKTSAGLKFNKRCNNETQCSVRRNRNYFVVSVWFFSAVFTCSFRLVKK